MKRTHLLGGIATAAVLAVGGVGIAAALPNPPAPAVAPAATSSARIGAAALAPGTALVDAGGRALYLFEADQGSTSTCNGPCAQIWPPLLIDGGAPTVAGDVQASLLGSTARDDGTQQITYNGHPLYYFTGDKKPGETRGQGLDRFGGPWYVLTPAGNKIDPDDPAAAPTATSGGYGY
jgi:predicted lipoprotein with Yx(FWY)xxD motif